MRYFRYFLKEGVRLKFSRARVLCGECGVIAPSYDGGRTWHSIGSRNRSERFPICYAPENCSSYIVTELARHKV